MSSPKYNHAITLAFALDTDLTEGELLEASSLHVVIAAARKRLDQIEQDKEISSFEIYDTYEN